MSTRRIAVLLWLAAAGCVAKLPEENLPCPCAAGWTCCPGANVCAEDASLCPSGTTGSTGEAGSSGSSGSRGTSGSTGSSGTTGATCQDACTEGTRECDLYYGARQCEVQATGCTDWTQPLACEPGEECFIGGSTERDVCSSGDAGQVAVDDIEPGPPYTEGMWITLTGANLPLADAGCLGVTFNGGIGPNLGSSSDTSLQVQIPDGMLDVEDADGGAAPVVLAVQSCTGTGVVQRVLVVHADTQATPPPYAAVSMARIDPASPVAGAPIDVLFHAKSYGQSTNWTVNPVLLSCAGCTGLLPGQPQFEVLWPDGGLIDSSTFTLAMAATADFDVRVVSAPAIGPDGGTLEFQVALQGFGGNATSGVVPVGLGGANPEPDPTFALDYIPDNLDHAVDPNGNVNLPPWILGPPPGYRHFSDGLSLVASGAPGTYDATLQTSAGFTWPARLGRGGDGGAMEIDISDGGSTSVNVFTLEPDGGGPTEGELDITLTNRATGGSRTVRLNVIGGP